MTKYILTAVLLLVMAGVVQADAVIEELVPDEASVGLLGGLDGLLEPEAIASYRLGGATFFGEDVDTFADIWSYDPVGAGLSAGKAEGTKRFGAGYDAARQCGVVYLRQVISF